MKHTLMGFVFVAIVVAIVGAGSEAQPGPGNRPGGPKGGPGGQKGGPSPLVRAVDDLGLSDSQRQTVVAAVRDYEDNGRRLADMGGASLLLKMKGIVSPEEYTKLRDVAEQSRRGPGRLNTDSIVEHFMSFDKNKDGMITKEELPERMQDMFAKGDTNKDGFLDKEEIKALAVQLAKEQSTSAGPVAGPGGGRGQRGRANNSAGVSSAAVERAVNDLKLTGKTKEAADAAIKANQADLRKVTEFARADLLLTMSDVLSSEECNKLETVLDRQVSFGDQPPGRGGRPPGRGGPGRGGPPRE